MAGHTPAFEPQNSKPDRPLQRTHAIPPASYDDTGNAYQRIVIDASIARILALDLGKFKNVMCAMDVATREHRFESLATTPAAIDDLLVRHRTSEPTRTLVVIETCDVAG